MCSDLGVGVVFGGGEGVATCLSVWVVPCVVDARVGYGELSLEVVGGL